MQRAIGHLLCVVMCWILGASDVSAERAQWERVNVDPREQVFLAISTHPHTPSKLFVASPRRLYESGDHVGHWQERFRVSGQARVSGIATDGLEEPVILVATTRGLYGSFDAGEHWGRLARGAGQEEQDCTAVAFHPLQPGTALLGTRRGLFTSGDAGRHWQEVAIPLAARDIVYIAFDLQDPNRVYLVTTGGLFAGSLTGERWQQVFTVIRAEDAEVEESEEDGTGEEHDVLHRLSAIAVDPQDFSTLYLAGSNGLMQSLDRGVTWRWMSQTGLGSSAIARVLPVAHSPTTLFAATRQGVARYDSSREQWQIITEGFAGAQVNDLAATPTQLWAATDQGLYRFQIIPGELSERAPPTAHELLANFAYEPTIAEMQEAAIRYAEVSPQKIASWRSQARLRALLPQLGISGDTNLTDFRHWDSGANPDALLRGERDVDWDTSVTWDLGDLIWSSDQTSIDVRSKLMVELRDEIVDDVTRTYFERRRLQVLLLTNPPSDQQAILEKALRLQELTAQLDGLTGGDFSARMKIDAN